MDDFLQYIESIKNIKIDADVLPVIQEKIINNRSLSEAAIKNLDSILKSDSPFKDFELDMWLRNIGLDFNIQCTAEEKDTFRMSRQPIFKIEPNSLRINTKSCGMIQFRVPPHTVKAAARNKQPAAQYYVITPTTFYNGINYIDIAFPVFENFFLHRGQKTTFLCMNKDLEQRVQTIASEEIFGPTLEQFKASGWEEKRAMEFYNELKLFSVPIKGKDGRTRPAVLADYIEIHVFKDNRIQIKGVEITAKKDLEYFVIKENNKKLGYIDLTEWEPIDIDESFSLQEPGKEAEFGVYFFDPSTGFDPERLTSSFIIWIGEGTGMVVDPLTNLPQYLDRKRINRDDIKYILLTHVHSDHDDGILEQILSGRVITVLTSRIIFNCFLKKVKAITGWEEKQIEKMIQFKELKLGKEFFLNAKTRIQIDYAFHAIPTLQFIVTYIDKEKGIKRSIAYSGDTNYNPNYIEQLVSERKLSRKRADSILHFIWESDCIIHDAGGGIHTDVKNLLQLPEETQKKIIAIHTHELPEGTPIHQAQKGEEIIFVKTDQVEQYRRLAKQLDDVPLFRKLTQEQKLEIMEGSKKEQFMEGQVILSMGDTARKFYIIHTGEVEIQIPDGRKIYLGKGDYFGEMAFFNKNKTRNATAYARTNVELLSLSENKFDQYKDQILDVFQNIVDNRPLLSKISFFKMLKEREINALSSLFVQKRYKKGDYIIRHGEIGDKFHITKYGVLDIIARDKDGREKLINEIGSGDPFGEIALIEKTKRTADVIVKSDYADIISIEKDIFQQIVSEYPGIAMGLEMIKNMYHRITKERL